MSAWIVSLSHIDLMVDAALRYSHGRAFYWYSEGNCGRTDRHELTYSNADEVGAMLYEENCRSVDFRYKEENPREEYHFPAFYSNHYTVVEALKQVQCYEYQSCEHEDWEKSKACAFCQQLTATLINYLPGYNEAPWGWDQPRQIEAVPA